MSDADPTGPHCTLVLNPCQPSGAHPAVVAVELQPGTSQTNSSTRETILRATATSLWPQRGHLKVLAMGFLVRAVLGRRLIRSRVPLLQLGPSRRPQLLRTQGAHGWDSSAEACSAPRPASNASAALTCSRASAYWSFLPK